MLGRFDFCSLFLNKMVYFERLLVRFREFLVGGCKPSEKKLLVRLDHFPKFRGENSKYMKPPPSNHNFPKQWS